MQRKAVSGKKWLLLRLRKKRLRSSLFEDCVTVLHSKCRVSIKCCGIQLRIFLSSQCAAGYGFPLTWLRDIFEAWNIYWADSTRCTEIHLMHPAWELAAMGPGTSPHNLMRRIIQLAGAFMHENKRSSYKHTISFWEYIGSYKLKKYDMLNRLYIYMNSDKNSKCHRLNFRMCYSTCSLSYYAYIIHNYFDNLLLISL